MRGLILVALLVTGPVQAGQSYPEAQRVVTVGGPVTEIVYALGEEGRIAARDTTSVYPPAATALPDVGYMRQLSAEGVLSLGPDLIIARETSGPLEAIEQLQAASIPMVLVKDGFTADAVTETIRTVAEALGVGAKASTLIARVEQDFDALAMRVGEVEQRKKVLFVLSTAGGRLNAAGRGTGADGLIALAGGHNVLRDAISGYKLVEAEAVIDAAPDVIVMMEPRGDHSSSADDVLSLAPVRATPAGSAGALLTIPGAALGFGPRTGKMALDLHEQLYGAGG